MSVSPIGWARGHGDYKPNWVSMWSVRLMQSRVLLFKDGSKRKDSHNIKKKIKNKNKNTWEGKQKWLRIYLLQFNITINIIYTTLINFRISFLVLNFKVFRSV